MEKSQELNATSTSTATGDDCKMSSLDGENSMITVQSATAMESNQHQAQESNASDPISKCVNDDHPNIDNSKSEIVANNPSTENHSKTVTPMSDITVCAGETMTRMEAAVRADEERRMAFLTLQRQQKEKRTIADSADERKNEGNHTGKIAAAVPVPVERVIAESTVIPAMAAITTQTIQGRTHKVITEGCNVIVTCIVKADDTSKEAVAVSSKLGLRFRNKISDPFQTAASFARSLVEGNKSYIRAVCDDLTKASDCDIMLSYGDGHTTTVMIRYKKDIGSVIGNERKRAPVVKDRLVFLVQLMDNGMGCVIRGKDSLYENIQCPQGSAVQELYVSPSNVALDDPCGITDESMKSTILITITDNVITSVETNPSRKMLNEFTRDDMNPQASKLNEAKSEGSRGGRSRKRATESRANDVDDIVVKDEEIIDVYTSHSPRTTTNGARTSSRKKRNTSGVRKANPVTGKDGKSLKKKNTSKNTKIRKTGPWIGEKIRKDFKDGIFYGVVVSYDEQKKFYRVEYKDGDSEDMLMEDLIQGVENYIASQLPPTVATIGNKNLKGNFSNDANFLVGAKVRKEFRNHGEFNGDIVEYNERTGWYKIIYEDGDSEETNTEGVIKGTSCYLSYLLSPGQVDEDGICYSSKSDESPRMIATKLGCDLKSLLAANMHRLSRPGCTLGPGHRLWARTIFYLPPGCDEEKLKLLM